MMKRPFSSKGSVLVEALCILGVLVCLVAGTHMAWLLAWKRKIYWLQQQRIQYDGVTHWRRQ